MLKLEILRAEQDRIDQEILSALHKRYEIRRKISALRIANGLPTVDAARMDVVLGSAAAKAAELGLPVELAQDVFRLLIDWSHRLDLEWRQKSGDEK